MEMSGERLIAADRQAVWTALNDPEVLKDCIPGCQSMEATEDGGFEAVVKQKVGPVSATFKGKVILQDVVAPESYTISGEGKGGAAGFAKGEAKVRLEDIPEGTKLAYDVDAKVGGKLAQLGGRVIDGVAKRVADQFFDRFKERLEGPNAGDGAAEADPAGALAAEARSAPAAEAAPDTPSGDAANAPEEQKKSWFSRIIGS